MNAWQKWAYYSQWVIALGAASACFETYITLQLASLSFWFYVLIFSASLLEYMVHFRFFSKKITNSQRQFFFVKNIKFLWWQFAIAAFLLVASCAKLGFFMLWPLALLALLSLGYSFFLLHPTHKGLLKYNGVYKLLTLSFCWAAVTAALPVLAAHQPIFQLKYVLIFMLRWLWLVAICLPFDVRDAYQDMQNGTTTLPTILGAKKTFCCCYLLVALHTIGYCLLCIFGMATLALAIANLLANIILMLSIYHSSRNLHQNESWFLLDANFIIHSAIISFTLLL